MPPNGSVGPIPYNAAMSSLPTRVRIVEARECSCAIRKRVPDSKASRTIAAKQNKAAA